MAGDWTRAVIGDGDPGEALEKIWIRELQVSTTAWRI